MSGYSPSKIVMPGALDDEPNVIVPRKIHPLLHILGAGRIDNVDGVAERATRQRRNRQASVIIPIVPERTDGIGAMPLGLEPPFLDGRARNGIECRLV